MAGRNTTAEKQAVKKPSRKDVQEKQHPIERLLERLQSVASLKRYLGPWEISPIEAEINSQLGLSDEIFLKYERQRTLTQRVEEVVGRIRPGDFADLTTRIYGAPKTLESVLADPATFIDKAQETLTEEYRVAREESLLGLRKKDLKPLQHHFFLLGPDLLREPEVLSVFQHAWLGGLYGHRKSAQRLTAMLDTFRPGKRSRTFSVDEAQERNRNNISRSKALKRLKRKYSKKRQTLSPEEARKQTEDEFTEDKSTEDESKDSDHRSGRVHDPDQEALILQKFREWIQIKTDEN